MQLIAPPAGPNIGGVYTDPYTALIGAAGQNGVVNPTRIAGTPTFVFCDDFTTDVSTATPSWGANVTNMSEINGITPLTFLKFDNGSGQGATQLTNYMTVAYLAVEIADLNDPNSLAAEEMSYALWGVFDTATNGPLSGHYIQNVGPGQMYLDAANNYLSDAEAAVAQLQLEGYGGAYYSNVNIYTPLATDPDGMDASQEYLTVATPEPGTWSMLALGLAGLAYALRRRARQSVA